VATSYIPVKLAIYPAKAVLEKNKPLPPGVELCLVAQVPDEKNIYRVYDRSGHFRPDLSPEIVRVLPTGGGAKVENGKPMGDFPAIKKSIAEQIKSNIQENGKSLVNPAEIDLKKLDQALDNAIESSDVRPGLNVGDRKKLITAVEGVLKEAADHLKANPPWKNTKVHVTITAKQIVDGLPFVAPKLDERALKGSSELVLGLAPTPKAGDVPPGKPDTQAAGTGPFQVLFLPDFEEQFAIHNCNFLAKTKYKYNFRNGTELESFSGNYDATDVPVKIVETVGRLVSAIGEVAKTRLQNLPPGASARGFYAGQGQPSSDFYLRIQTSIEPGVYRIQKSWEIAASADLDSMPADHLCGLFAEIGLPIVESISVVTGAEHDAAVNPPAPGGGTK
jgi:hypothetical protein